MGYVFASFFVWIIFNYWIWTASARQTLNGNSSYKV